MKRGMWMAVGAYSVWGVFPVYWKWLSHVSAVQLFGHRIVWSCLILLAFVVLTRQAQTFRQVAFTARVLRVYLIAAILIGVNWFLYVWAVNAGFVIESSLGYFINPLVSVSLGMILFRERLRPLQWLPIALAALGVVYLTVLYGAPPWIALSLAFTFGFYGLVKKIAPLNSLYGLLLETGILFVPALAWLLYVETTGQGAFGHLGATTDWLMAGTGIVTTVPMLMFAGAARRIPLSMIGILQYIAPTLQFTLGVLVYGEPFSQTQLVGFGLVWIALIIFAVEGFAAHRAQAAAIVAE